MHKDSKSGLKKFLDSFKHDETSSDGITAIKTLETADYSKENSSKATISKKDHSNKEMSIPEVTITSSPIEKDEFESKIPIKVSESSESAKTKPKEERDSLKRSHSFRDSILLKDEILPEQDDSNVKESFHNIRKHFGSSDKKKSNKIKRSESCKETAKEKEGFHGIRGFFDSITHKSPTKSSQTSKINDEEHIYDTVGKPESSSILKQTSSKTTDPKQKDDPSSMKKLLDSFRHKDSKPKVLKETKKDEKENDKVDSAVPSISKLVKSANEEKKIFIKKDLTKESQQPENLEAPKQKDVPKITLNLSPKFTKEKNEETPLPSIQINESPAPSKSKTSMFSSISDNFTAIKDKVIHSKDEKKEETLDQNKISEEYDLQNAAIKNQFPDSSVGSYKPIDDISFINVSLKPEDENVQHKNTNITISDKNISSPSKPSQQSNQQPVISDKNVLKPSSIPRPRVEPETPETLYDTCCMRLATLLGKKALEIVSEKTKAPPKKPPKPSAEAIARARAAVVSQRLRGLQSKNQSIGEGIPVGYDGIRFADEETESSCDYKDVENFDYILDYELVNRFKCDSKLDTFTDPSTCSGMSSYYTPDTVTLKDENFSDAPLETINLDNNDPNLFQHLSSPQNQTDFHSLPSKVKSKDEREKLKSLAKAGQSISSTTLTPIKKVPPPLPPKPNILPKSKDTQNKSSMSQCINGLSLSPRLQPKFAKDSAVTKKRPLMVAGLKGTEFTSLQTKSKNHSKERTFNAILKNESLKNVSTISPLHKPLQGTKSSPLLSQSCVISESSTSKKQSPKRPPPPISSIHTEEKKSKAAPPVPEKPKREGRTASTSAVIEKRTVSPPRPPPPVITKIHAAPPRPPPPSPLTSKSVNESSNQSIENQVEIKIQEPLPKLDESSSPTKLLVTELFIPEIDSKQTKIICSENSAKEKDEIIVEDIPQDILNESSINFKKENEISEKSVLERSESRTPDFIFVKTDTEMVEIAPKPPPRGRRIRSRTVEIPPKQKSPESTLRRSQSLSDADVKIKTSHLTISPTTTKADLKHLYTSVNKDGKKTVVDGSQSPNVSSRPLPAPPPPPRKFRSLDRKPKSQKKKVGEEVLETNKNDSPLFQNISNDSSIKPPERKRKGDKQRFFSLSTERKRTSSEFETQSLRMPRSYSVPLKPDRKFKHSHPEYDENANIAFPTVAEIHHSAALLDECGNEITEASSSANIPDAVDLPANGNHIEKINPHPRQKKEKNPKKSHSNWYDKSVSGDEPWELLNWDSSGTTEREFKNFETTAEKSKMRRRSDPIVSRKIRQTSKFYVDVEIGNEGLPLVDKETSPLHLDCSEKSVQTSLETLSQGIISHDEQSELAEESSDTDNLLKIVKTLQSELKSTLNRHKSLDDDENDTSNAATDSEKMDDRKKYLKTPSIQSSASEIWPITSSDESEAEISSGRAANLSEIALNRKKNKIFFIAREILTSEEIFVDTLKLLNVDFKAAVEAASKQRGSPVVPDEILSQILNHLPQLQQLNENLLMELKDRIDNWDKTGKIADIIVKIGPFLKLYSWYIHDFESNVALLEDAKKKYPAFAQVVKEFEASTRCKRLFLNHFMLKPIQRIPQYRLLLQEYLHHLSEDSLDYQDTITALQIVSEVADHANNSMKQGDNAQKLISIQNSIMGHKEIIKPGRLFVKEGELMKLSRKGMQPRINHELPLSGMKVAIPIQQDYQNEFSIISVTRSFTLAARSQEERQEWIVALTKAIEENLSRRSTFTNIRLQRKMQDKNSEDDEGEFVLGKKAPVWIPDARVTMCQLCTSEFTVTFRRHHCRACGKVVCSICSSNRIPLAYLGSSKVNRVCDECYSKLGHETASTPENVETDSDNQQIAIKPHLRTEHRYVKKGKRNLPSVLKEVCANDQGSTISGYLQKRIGKSWKKDWFVVKDKVLYEYKASEDVAALSSTPLLGYNIEAFSEAYENVDMSLLFQLTHPGQAPTIFHTDSTYSTEDGLQLSEKHQF
ncbi:FYVE, RhoGEF and PH domain-containing protein 6 [Caerostris extrusa]|uniref:FYVE, RhoGEF and PH domain-containing protein 6 n=1 Tax=Caerostris extrusa TaxID=172846 RepID=A0AAV4NN57_CAEEX|nr:FYVE, RhoGEF and PH domain-containing protein 6 [Caerostris extrusa]